jgi:putative endonuclease
MSGRTRILYVGVTNDIERRDYEHKNKSYAGFTNKYKLDRLVYFEQHRDVRDAIEREKQLKSWRREKKVALIESLNPKWRDLSLEWRSGDIPRPPQESLRVDPSATPQKNAAPVGMTKSEMYKPRKGREM